MAYSYHYTVESYVNWQTALYVTQDISSAPSANASLASAAAIQYFENNPNYPNVVNTYLENNGSSPTSPTVGVATTAKNTVIEPGFEVIYCIRVYMYDDGTNGTGGAAWYWLGSTKNSSAKAAGLGSNAGKTMNLNIISNTAVTVNNQSNMTVMSSGNYYNYSVVNGGTPKVTNLNKVGAVGDTYKIAVKPKATGWSMFNAITFTANINNTGVTIDPNSNTLHPTLLGIIPGFNVSKKRSVPSIPTNLQPKITVDLATAAQNNGGWSTFGYTYYDYCGMYGKKPGGKPQFIGLYVKALPVSSSDTRASGSYTYAVYTVDLAGTVINTVVSPTPEKGTSAAPGPNLSKIFAQLRLVTLANCSGSGAGAAPNGLGSTTGGLDPALPSNEDRYNPPPHIGARSISYGQRMLQNDTAMKNAIIKDGAALNAYYQAMDIAINNPKLTIGYGSENGRTSNLGRIIQDPASAKAINNNPDKITGYGQDQLWGFRFMYNPTTISYSTASDTSIDWTLGRTSPAVLLSGNQNVSVQIYLNRIPDMAYLRNQGSVSMEQAYGYKLGQKAIDGILNRGTEYDIEFLYRVINGDPAKNALLFGDKYKGETADYGYTTGIPCWMHLNDNMRYFGSVANISVNHAIFNLDMVPILSTVTIGFTRYPALWNSASTSDAKTSQKALYGKDGALQKAVNNTAGTAAPTK